MVEPDPAAGRAPLPAPYVDPWRLLARDLGAVAASLRLRAWELWRRNGENALWRPRFWPSALGRVFWPLVLLTAVLLAGVVGVSLVRSLQVPAEHSARGTSAVPVPPAAPDPTATAPPTLSPEVPAEPAPPPPEANGPRSAPVADAPTAQGSAPPAAVAPGEAAPPAGPTRAPLEKGPAGSPPAAPAPGSGDSPDPLDERFARVDPEGWILERTLRPSRGCLTLTLADGFRAAPAERRRTAAAAWQRAAADLGYERLELLDGRGRSLGRSALVGSGMILLDPVSPS